MAKQRNDYDNSWYPRLKRWLAGGSGLLNDKMVEQLSVSSDAHRVITDQEIAQREEEMLRHQEEVAAHEAALYERAHAWSVRSPSGTSKKASRRQAR